MKYISCLLEEATTCGLIHCGTEGNDTISKCRGGEGWWVDGKERSGEGTPPSNRLGDYTGRHYFEEGVTLQTPA